jgi:hypothetical protein
MRNAYSVLVGKPEGKRPLGRTRSKWKDNCRTDLMKIGWKGVDWTHLDRDRDQWWDDVITVIKLRFPEEAGHFSRRTLLHGVNYICCVHLRIPMV